MKRFRPGSIAMLLALPFAATAKAQVGVGVGVGPEVVPAPEEYGPPVCEWGYYSYYPYACAPYGYYGPQWFYGGVFIGVGPWYQAGATRLGLSRRLRLSRRIRISAAGAATATAARRICADAPICRRRNRGGYAGAAPRAYDGGGARGYAGWRRAAVTRRPRRI